MNSHFASYLLSLSNPVFFVNLSLKYHLIDRMNVFDTTSFLSDFELPSLRLSVLFAYLDWNLIHPLFLYFESLIKPWSLSWLKIWSGVVSESSWVLLIVWDYEIYARDGSSPSSHFSLVLLCPSILSILFNRSSSPSLLVPLNEKFSSINGTGCHEVGRLTMSKPLSAPEVKVVYGCWTAFW